MFRRCYSKITVERVDSVLIFDLGLIDLEAKVIQRPDSEDC